MALHKKPEHQQKPLRGMTQQCHARSVSTRGAAWVASMVNFGVIYVAFLDDMISSRPYLVMVSLHAAH